VTDHPTFRKYLMAEKLANTLPSRDYNVEQKVKVYRQFYDKADEKDHGVLQLGESGREMNLNARCAGCGWSLDT
jgi:ASC-1-like (ASCH) protein